jgi:tight adherence protein C
MNTVLLLALLGSLLFVASLLIGSALLGAPNLARRLGRAVPQDHALKKGWRTYLKSSERMIRPLGELVPRSPGEMSRQERRLVRAGIRRKDGPVLLYGVKVLLAILILLGFIAFRLMWANPILYVVLSMFFGALLPDIWLTRRIAARNDRIQLALPNALDLTVVCVEAGMGLDQALMRIGREMSQGFPELSDELNILSLEINAGRKRADALRNLGDRTNNKDLKALVAALIQTDRFGTSIAQSLRVFSESMRTTRRLRAEEHAAKMSVKMLPPLVFFIFPAMFIVILGPAVIAVIRNLLPVLGGK